MGDLQIVIAARFVSAAGLNALANCLKVRYPIPLVLAQGDRADSSQIDVQC